MTSGGTAQAQPLGSVLVLGLGKSGKSVARYCVDQLGRGVDRLFIAAGAQTPDSLAFVESIARDGVEWAFGDDALKADRGRFDLCIASPGIPYWHDLYVAGLECSDRFMSEVEFAWLLSEPNSTWVAITGTNGKTTTTSLAAHVLRECGFAASAVGNIGDVCLDAVIAGDTNVYVAEVSSYQLYSTSVFAPDVAVLLNITPDHIHWHRTLDAYAEAKFNVLRRNLESGRLSNDVPSSPKQGRLSRQVAILDATNDVVRAKVRELKALSPEERGLDYIPMGTADGITGDMRARCGAENAAFITDEGVLNIAFKSAEHAVASVSDLQIKGEHNASNALAAAAIAVALGADDASIGKALASFAPLEHRIEPCGTVAGVRCYNDSKATNVDATMKALESFPREGLVVLLGGDDKGTDLADLMACVHAHARVAVCFGEAGPRFASALESQPSENAAVCLRAQHLEDALDTALEAAHEGEVVLLSPACASFDEFHSFEERGDVFKALVADRASRGEA
jgi:UDP-N-acetylmuramoylalanine--D-glutamate ligase